MIFTNEALLLLDLLLPADVPLLLGDLLLVLDTDALLAVLLLLDLLSLKGVLLILEDIRLITGEFPGNNFFSGISTMLLFQLKSFLINFD